MNRDQDETKHLHQLERRVYRINDLPVEIVEAVKASKMDSSYDHLNTLLDEK